MFAPAIAVAEAQRTGEARIDQIIDLWIAALRTRQALLFAEAEVRLRKVAADLASH